MSLRLNENLDKDNSDLNDLNKIDFKAYSEEDPDLTEKDKRMVRSGTILSQLSEPLREELAEKLKEIAQKSDLNQTFHSKLIDELKTRSFEKLQNLEKRFNHLLEKVNSKEHQEKMKLKKVPFETKEIQDQLENINKHLDQNKEALGLKAVKEFKEWCLKELKKEPITIKKAEDTYQNLLNHRDGTRERINFYERKISPLFKEIGLSPQDSEFIKQNGKSEKEKYLANIIEMKSEIENLESAGFFSKEVVKDELLKIATINSGTLNKTLSDQTSRIKLLKETAQFEQTQFIRVKELKIKVNGRQISAMSERSLNFMLEDQAKRGLDAKVGSPSRLAIAKMWFNFAQIEGKLAEKLETDVLKKFPDLLEEAITIFEELNFDEKVKLTEKFNNLAKQKEAQEELTKVNFLLKSCKAIENNKFISKKTKNLYSKWFKDEKNHLDPKTKEFSLEELEKHYKKLIDKKPDEKARNLAVYEEQKKQIDQNLDEIKKYLDLDEDLEDQLKKFSKTAEKEGWKKRKKVLEDSFELLSELKSEYGKPEKIKDEEEVEKVEKVNTFSEAIKQYDKLIQKEEFEDAMDYLKDFIKENKENLSKIEIKNAKKLVRQAAERWEMAEELAQEKEEMKEIKSKQELEEEFENYKEEVMKDDKFIKQEMKDLHIQARMIKNAEINELRGGNIDMKVNKEKKAKEKIKEDFKLTTNSEENENLKEVFANFEENLAENNDQEIFQENENINLDNQTSSQEEIKMKEEQIENIETSLRKGKVNQNIQLKNSLGKAISAEEAQKVLEKKNKELSKKILSKSREKLKKDKINGSEKFLNLQNKAKEVRKIKQNLSEMQKNAYKKVS